LTAAAGSSHSDSASSVVPESDSAASPDACSDSDWCI